MMFWTAGGLLARELAAAALVGAGFLTVFALAELWRRFGDPPVEWTRKLVHFLGGVIAATFPWAFQSRITVVALATLFTLILWATRRFGLLPSVHAVERRSEGGLYFPVAVLALFLLAYDRPVFYLISILVLVVADAAAALVGTTYGRQKYAVEKDRRSIEGSVVFFLTTFLVTHLPLLLLAGLDPLLSVLIALQLAILVTQFEAISLRGSDNIVVPLATFYLLVKMTPQGVDHMAVQLTAQLVIIVLLGLMAWRVRTLTFSGAIALMLFTYGAWGLGGPEWVVAPVVGLLGFVAVRRLFPADVPPADGRYQVTATFYVCIVAALLFLANNAIETLIPDVPAGLRFADPLYVPFIAVCAAQLALIFTAQLRPFGAPRRAAAGSGGGAVRVLGSGSAAFVLVAPLGLAVGVHGVTVGGLLLAGAAVAMATAIYVGIDRSGAWPEGPPWNVRLQALSVALAAAVVVPLELWRIGAL
jgi:dolichol kinase